MTALTAIASSGLQAAQVRSGAAAHNIANLQTPQFQRQSVAQEARNSGGVTASVGSTGPTGPRLEQDVVAQMSATYSFKANLQTLRTADQMLGTLLDVHA
ncbi:flagellar basal body rod protein [Simplicispira psychrophila]|uniref:flagellar basal body rod protein n=1 Tax=Simplicispira psychrophila TaxID=80882 RepID=UPI000481B5A2|nr:flagellar basal body rod protein [Simplicispira psychrophila]